MKRYNLILLTIASLIFASCNDFLGRRLDTNYSQKQVFESYSRMRDFGLGVYAYLPGGFNRIDGSMLSSATDDAVDAWTESNLQRLNNGSWGPYNNPDDQWAHYYDGIRKANMFLEQTQNYKDILYAEISDTTNSDRKNTFDYNKSDIGWMRAEVRVLRAMFYFELQKRYGGVPLVTKTLTLDDDLNIPRNSYDEVTNFIVSECDAAVNQLRDSWKGFDNDKYTGRVTKGAALTIKAKTLQYAASPLNNTNNDQTKWQDAAEAANDVIALNQYALHGDYSSLFHTYNSDEIILERRYGANNAFERANFPIGFEGSRGGTNPSQSLVDAYETINGLPIDQDSQYDPQNPYDNRDPRLQQTIIVNNSNFKGRNVEIWNGGLDADKPRATRTGYYLKKYLDENIDLVQNKTSVHTWIIFRYGGILLDYAEAMNEAYGPDDAAGYSMTAREALNMIRQRAGMPDVSANTKAEFRARLRNERRVEMAFEEQRFWDVRRWKIGDETLAQPVRGVGVTKNADDSFTYKYNVPEVEQRVFSDKMYRYPIPRIEINKSAGALNQNPGWN